MTESQDRKLAKTEVWLNEGRKNIVEERANTVNLSKTIPKELSRTSKLDVKGIVGSDTTMQKPYYGADVEINSNRYNGGNSGPYKGSEQKKYPEIFSPL